MIESKQFHAVIAKLLSKHGLKELPVRYVGKLPMGNSPFIPACTMPDPETKVQTIFILEKMDEQVIESGKSFQSGEISTSLATDDLFFKHTVLHEIYHVLNHHNNSAFDERMENDRIADNWAFEQLKLSGDLAS